MKALGVLLHLVFIVNVAGTVSESLNVIQSVGETACVHNIDLGDDLFPCNIRGGSENGVGMEISSAEATIEHFLSDDGSSATSLLEEFHFHGWRWHTLSLVRDSSRLQRFSQRLAEDPSENVRQRVELGAAVDHVIDFNLNGLQRIENNVFFPWLKEKLTQSNDVGGGGEHLNEAFREVIDGIQHERQQVLNLANGIRTQTKKMISCNSNSNDTSEIQKATVQISEMSGSLSSLVKNIFDKEVRLLAPAVAKLVPAKEQHSVNNKILKNLGIFQSRAILVGMSETLDDSNYGNEKERKLFQQEIPYIPRKMIPRWRRTLYEPQAGMLEQK